MAVVVTMEIANSSTEQYDQVFKVTNPDGEPAASGIFHVVADDGKGGLFICDVWETPEAFQTFVDTKIGPAMASIGSTEQPKVTILPVHNFLERKR